MSIRSVSKRVALEVLERDGYCINCGSPYNPDIAHFIGRGQGGLGIKENLAVLCRTCHHALDNGNNETIKSCIHATFKAYLKSHYPDFTDDMRKERNRWDTEEL